MVCQECGLVMSDAGCPDCGMWLCAECLSNHDARHYDESGMADEDAAECWPAPER